MRRHRHRSSKGWPASPPRGRGSRILTQFLGSQRTTHKLLRWSPGHATATSAVGVMASPDWSVGGPTAKVGPRPAVLIRRVGRLCFASPQIGVGYDASSARTDRACLARRRWLWPCISAWRLLIRRNLWRRQRNDACRGEATFSMRPLQCFRDAPCGGLG